MHLQESTLFEVKVTLNVAQCPLHHVTYAPTEFEVATSKALGGEAFTRNSIFDLDLGKSYGVGGDTITRNVTDAQTHGRTDARTDGRRTDFGTK